MIVSEGVEKDLFLVEVIGGYGVKSLILNKEERI
jgi:hypothetical protein